MIQKNKSLKALRVLNYIKKNNCRVRMRWFCGIQIHRVWKDEKEHSYPMINEDIWYEISHLFKRNGEYQQTHFYDLQINNLPKQIVP